MKEKGPFLEVVRFFQRLPPAIPGSPEYNAAFCHLLVSAASADAASIWQVDAEDQLHLISSTDIPHDEAMNIILRQGEGIAGAAVLIPWKQMRKFCSLEHLRLSFRNHSLDSGKV